jgi:hypothetical protein
MRFAVFGFVRRYPLTTATIAATAPRANPVRKALAAQRMTTDSGRFRED